MAQASKEKVYLGEGIDVHYYLYAKAPIVSSELREYPKLNNFIKRFVDVSSATVDRVNHAGEIYNRHPIYAARVYPEKVGKLQLDSVKMRIRGPHGEGLILWARAPEKHDSLWPSCGNPRLTSPVSRCTF